MNELINKKSFKDNKDTFSNYYQLLKEQEESHNETSTSSHKKTKENKMVSKRSTLSSIDENKSRLMDKSTKKTPSSKSNSESGSESDDSIDREAMKELSLEKKQDSKVLKSSNSKDKNGANKDKNEDNNKRKRDPRENIDMSEFDNYHIGNLDFAINLYQVERWLKQNDVKHGEVDIKKG